jgi:hypothetical protein
MLVCNLAGIRLSLAFLGGLQPVHISENEETRAGIRAGLALGPIFTISRIH